jgi:phosphoenolpyruvate carboxykinase (GTP)
VLKWILERVEGRGGAEESPVGFVPTQNALTLDGLQISGKAMKEVLRVDAEDWEDDLADSKQFFEKFGDRLPGEIREEHEKLSRRLSTEGASASVGR